MLHLTRTILSTKSKIFKKIKKTWKKLTYKYLNMICNSPKPLNNKASMQAKTTIFKSTSTKDINEKDNKIFKHKIIITKF